MTFKSFCFMRHCLAFSLYFLLIVLTPIYGEIISHECLDRQEVFGRTTTIYHRAAVEPTIAVNPRNRNHIVAAWQQDRLSNGAALETGISYTKDGGKHWHNTKVPFQICDGGISQRSGDSWLSYAADGSKVYLCTAFLNATQEPNTPNQFGVAVTISEDDGASWSKPRVLGSSMLYLSEPTKQFANLDKSSITADPNNPERAIAVWVIFNPASSSHGDTQGSYTKDGGKNWSAPQIFYDPFPDLVRHGLSNGIRNDSNVGSNIVTILPHKLLSKKRRLSGDYLNFALRLYARPNATNAEYTSDAFPFQFTLADVVVVRSKDHGKTWEKNAKVVVPTFVNKYTYTGGYTYDENGNITGGIGTLMRNDQTIPSCNVNPSNGYLYVAYQTSTFRSDQLSQIGITTSRNGGKTWTTGAQVSRTPVLAPNPQAFNPFVAVTENGRVGILYVDFRNDDKLDPNSTKMDAWLAIYQEVKDPNGGSTGIGLDFIKEIRLSKESYIAQNGAMTGLGVMVDGDYQFLTTQRNRFYAIYTKSFNGPFTPAVPFFVDTVHNAIVLLDSNYRTAPFVSIIRNTRHGAQLLSTKELKYELK